MHTSECLLVELCHVTLSRFEVVLLRVYYCIVQGSSDLVVLVHSTSRGSVCIHHCWYSVILYKPKIGGHDVEIKQTNERTKGCKEKLPRALTYHPSFGKRRVVLFRQGTAACKATNSHTHTGRSKAVESGTCAIASQISIPYHAHTVTAPGPVSLSTALGRPEYLLSIYLSIKRGRKTFMKALSLRMRIHACI
jgi:hypothetical protein